MQTLSRFPQINFQKGGAVIICVPHQYCLIIQFVKHAKCNDFMCVLAIELVLEVSVCFVTKFIKES